jgi:hypothetical protein
MGHKEYGKEAPRRTLSRANMLGALFAPRTYAVQGPGRVPHAESDREAVRGGAQPVDDLLVT